jgi:hypothetical protein
MGTICDIDTKGPFPLMPHGLKRGEKVTKGYLVGGHYQIFCVDSLEYIARNILKKGRTYYIGKPHIGNTGICLTTLRGMIISPSEGEKLDGFSDDPVAVAIYREIKV